MSTYLTKRATELGLKKVDARSDLVIQVEAEDIKAATKKNSKCCAFAQAAKRQFPDISAAYFFRSAAWLEYEDKLVRYILPPSVQKEIVSFDRSKKMMPGIYQLSRPAKSTRMSQVKKRNSKRKGRHQPADTKITRKVRHRTTAVRSLFEPVAA